MNDSIRVDYKEEGDNTIVTPYGEIGYPEANAFRNYLRKAQERRGRVLVDLANVQFMSTPGLATLVEALQSSKRSGNKLVLAGLQDRVRAVFEIARLNTVFTIVTDIQTGMQS